MYTSKACSRAHRSPARQIDQAGTRQTPADPAQCAVASRLRRTLRLDARRQPTRGQTHTPTTTEQVVKRHTTSLEFSDIFCHSFRQQLKSRVKRCIAIGTPYNYVNKNIVQQQNKWSNILPTAYISSCVRISKTADEQGSETYKNIRDLVLMSTKIQQ